VGEKLKHFVESNEADNTSSLLSSSRFSMVQDINQTFFRRKFYQLFEVHRENTLADGIWLKRYHSNELDQ